VEEARTECQHSGQHQCKHEHINCAFETSYFDRNRRSALASTRIRDNHALRSSPPCCTSRKLNLRMYLSWRARTLPEGGNNADGQNICKQTYVGAESSLLWATVNERWCSQYLHHESMR